MRSKLDILRDISVFEPLNENWLSLEELLEELWAIGIEKGDTPFLFSIFERFPNDDGAGVFWSIVHGLESAQFGYKKELESSLQKVTSEMGKIMMKRLHNG